MSYMAEMVRAADCSPLLSSERDTLAEATCFEREVVSFLVPISACDGADGGEVLGVGHTDSRSNAIVVSECEAAVSERTFPGLLFFYRKSLQKKLGGSNKLLDSCLVIFTYPWKTDTPLFLQSCMSS